MLNRRMKRLLKNQVLIMEVLRRMTEYPHLADDMIEAIADTEEVMGGRGDILILYHEYGDAGKLVLKVINCGEEIYNDVAGQLKSEHKFLKSYYVKFKESETYSADAKRQEAKDTQ